MTNTSNYMHEWHAPQLQTAFSFRKHGNVHILQSSQKTIGPVNSFITHTPSRIQRTFIGQYRMTLPFGIPAGCLTIHRTMPRNKYIRFESPCCIISTVVTTLISIKSIVYTIKPRLYVCFILIHEIFRQNIVMIYFQIVITGTGGTQG